MPRIAYAHRLFFALMPPAGLLDELAWLRDRERQGRAEADDRLHITMFLFDRDSEFQSAIATRICQVLNGQLLPRCRVAFEQLVHGKASTLLLPSDKLNGVLRLQRSLAVLLRTADMHAASYWRFNPHMTLRRGKAVGETLAIDAVSWTAHEIVLLDSLIGLTQYNEIGRWPLTKSENR